MSLIKQRVIDQIEIVSEFKHIQIRFSNQVLEDGEIIAESYEREIVHCGDYTSADTHEVRAIADAVWTAEIITKWNSQTAPA